MGVGGILDIYKIPGKRDRIAYRMGMDRFGDLDIVQLRQAGGVGGMGVGCLGNGQEWAYPWAVGSVGMDRVTGHNPHFKGGPVGGMGMGGVHGPNGLGLPNLCPVSRVGMCGILRRSAIGLRKGGPVGGVGMGGVGNRDAGVLCESRSVSHMGMRSFGHL